VWDNPYRRYQRTASKITSGGKRNPSEPRAHPHRRPRTGSALHQATLTGPSALRQRNRARGRPGRIDVALADGQHLTDASRCAEHDLDDVLQLSVRRRPRKARARRQPRTAARIASTWVTVKAIACDGGLCNRVVSRTGFFGIAS